MTKLKLHTDADGDLASDDGHDSGGYNELNISEMIFMRSIGGFDDEDP